MHMAVLGWFGGSVVWFLPLLWRVAKSLLPNGGGLRGPGTIRLWFGFFCVLLSGSTLEAALFHSFSFYAEANRCGQTLFGLLGGAAGGKNPLVIGCGAALLFLVSLPWLCNFQWRSVARWANSAFGLGLNPEWLAVSEKPAREAQGREKPSRGRVSRERGEARGMGSIGGIADSAGFRSGSGGMPGRTSHDAPAIGIPSPTSREGGRYQRPTVWRPPPARKAEAQKPLQTGNSTTRPAASYSDHYPGARPAASKGDRRDPLEAIEPVAPAGWLKPDETSAKRENALDARSIEQADRAGNASANVPQSRGFTRPMRPNGSGGHPAGESGVDGLPSTTLAQTAGAVRNAAVQRSSSDRIVPRASPLDESPAPGRSANVEAAGPTSESPLTLDTPAPAQPIPAPDTISAALRAIEEKTARWTVRGNSRPGTSGSGENTTSATPAGNAMGSTMMAASIAPLAPATPTATVAPHEAPATSSQSSSPATHQSASTEPQLAANKVTPNATLLPASSEVAAAPVFSRVAGAYSATLPSHDGYTFIASAPPGGGSDVGETPTVTEAVELTDDVSLGDAIVHRDESIKRQAENIGHGVEQEKTSPEVADHAEPATTETDAPRAKWNFFASSTSGRPEVNSTSFIPQEAPAAPTEPEDKRGHRFSSDSPSTHEQSEPTPLESIFAPQQAAGPSHPEPDEITLADAEPASNVVQFPRAVPGGIARIPAFTDAPLSPADTRPPVRGFIPTEFEFHAPAASAVDLPGLDLLEPASDEVEPVSEQHLAETGQLIEQRLQEFKVPVTVVGASAGPVITRFEVEPALGVRGSQIVGLMKDLSRGLGLTSIRVVETIPGKTCMGLELPNAKRQMIRLSEILEADVYRDSKSFLTIAMGKDIVGNPVVTDLARAPHMLVAGTTGSGKSVAINAMILSLLYKATPADVRLIMIDPKMLELSVYEGIPHLLAPVVTDMKLAANALNWCVGEMEKRYKLMSAVGVRNLQGFNQKVRNADAAGKKLTNPFSLTPDAPEPLSTLPMIVVVIDELADLMMVAGKQIEQLIARLAQKARAAGIHLILATQRPSVDVITGLIKANIPTRVAFQVSSKIDSRTILDQMGAESLLGAGDMLFLPPGTGYPQRVHGAFVADEEVHSVVEYLKQFGEPEYEEGILSGPTGEGGAQDLFGDAPDAEADPLYDEAVSFVLRTRRASISSVQRQLRIGYNRAARLVEQMETAGLVSPMGTNGNREVLAPGPAE
jgi:S-DNA-T family DNA segregation ATPase FtsK/SpoIIIE